MAAKKLTSEQRPASENINSNHTYQNPGPLAGFHEGQCSSCSTPDLTNLASASNQTSHTFIASLSSDHEEETGNRASLSKDKEKLLQQAQRSTVALRPKRQNQQGEAGSNGKDLPSLETNDDYVQMRSSKGSPHPWDDKTAVDEFDYGQVSSADRTVNPSETHFDEYYMVMCSNSETSSTKAPIKRGSLGLEKEAECPLINPLYVHTLPKSATDRRGIEPTTANVSSSVGDYVDMKSIN